MRIRLLTVGRPKDRALDDLHDRYADRIRGLGVPCQIAWVPDVRPGGRFADDHVRERESRSLLQSLPARGTVIAVDRAGTLWSTEEVASRLERWASPAATFLVGGPLGHHRLLLERATLMWSLSPLTFPHEIARVLVAEQLYRALSILRGLPYHK